MPRFETRRRVPFTPDQMFKVVADVEQYPEFLPLCEGLHIESRREKEESSTLIATMDVGYKAIKESFKTKVDLNPLAHRIDVTYLDGPFSHLENRWCFYKRETGCEIEFYINYAFRSAMLGLLMGKVFDTAFRKFSQSFEDRAKEVYGRA